MKLWRCSSARSPRTALPSLTCFQKPYISVLLLLGEGSRMINRRQPAVCTICFALRESTGLLQNVWDASDCNESFVTTFWPHSKITDTFPVEISTNYLCLSLGTNLQSTVYLWRSKLTICCQFIPNFNTCLSVDTTLTTCVVVDATNQQPFSQFALWVCVCVCVCVYTHARARVCILPLYNSRERRQDVHYIFPYHASKPNFTARFEVSVILFVLLPGSILILM
jgi:hypothetical protein